MKYTKLSEQTFDTPIDSENNNDTETSLHCDLCKKVIGGWGYIHILKLETTKQITFLCSKECKKRFKSIKTCPQCGTEFDVYRKKLYHVKFCSRKCYSESKKQRCGLCQVCGKQIEGFDKNKKQPRKCCSLKCAAKLKSTRYKTHYFCDRNNHWVKIEDARKPNPNYNSYFTCPELGCNNNRLRISSRKAKLNQIRDNVKRIE